MNDFSAEDSDGNPNRMLLSKKLGLCQTMQSYLNPIYNELQLEAAKKADYAEIKNYMDNANRQFSTIKYKPIQEVIYGKIADEMNRIYSNELKSVKEVSKEMGLPLSVAKKAYKRYLMK